MKVTYKPRHEAYSEYTELVMFSKHGNILWTGGEEQRLMNSYKKIPREKLLMLFPGRTYQAIKQRAYILKIPRKGLNFTPEEDDRLLELYHYTGLTYGQMSKEFTNRSAQSLRVRMVKLRRLRGGG